VSKALVPQFQEEITFGQKRIQDLLRMAQLLSGKLGLTDLQRWIEYELNGYPNSESAPDYRTVVSTELQYFNPVQGWCTAVGHRTFRFTIRQPVTELERFAERDHVEFASTKLVPLVSLSGDPIFPKTNQRYIISGSEFTRILGTVKNKLLAWSIELEQRNILGENMAFNEHEKNSAKQQTFNIQNMHGVIGDLTDSHVNLYDFGTINQVLKDHGVGQAQRNELENLLDELKSAKPQEKKATKSKLLDWVATNGASLGTLALELTKAFTT
jgi:hypothetical protein